MKKLLLALACIIGATVPSAFAQMTQVTGTGLRIGSSLITTGTVCAVAVDSNENPIVVAIGGGLEYISGAAASMLFGAGVMVGSGVLQ